MSLAIAAARGAVAPHQLAPPVRRVGSGRDLPSGETRLALDPTPPHLFPPARSRPFTLRGSVRESVGLGVARTLDLASVTIPAGLYFVARQRVSLLSSDIYPVTGGGQVFRGESLVFDGSPSADQPGEWIDETAIQDEFSVVFPPGSQVRLKAVIVPGAGVICSCTVFARLFGWLTDKDLSYAI